MPNPAKPSESNGPAEGPSSGLPAAMTGGFGLQLISSSAHSTASGILSPGTRVGSNGRYEIIELVALGLMGSVHKARDTLLSATVALLALGPEWIGSPSARLSFLRQARVSNDLSHPSIARVHELDFDPVLGLVFIVTDLLSGETLRETLTRMKADGRSMAPADAATVVDQVLSALEAAHDFTIHRGLRPEHIFLCRDGSLQLLNLGIVAALGGRLPLGDRLIEATGYLAPEQLARDAGADTRVDLYACGVMLYEMLTSEIPVGSDFDLPSKLRDDVSEEVDRVIARALARREHRFASASEMRQALSKAMGRDAPPTAPGKPAASARIAPLDALPQGTWWPPATSQRDYAEQSGLPLWFENLLGIRFVLVPPGTFTMGSAEAEAGRDGDETPHQVTISKPFYLAHTQVTNGQFRRFRDGHDSSSFKGHGLNGDSQPAVYVSWDDANEFSHWLGRIEGLDDIYRLPSEAEWEYACRAGTTSAYFWGDDLDQAATHANTYDPVSKREFGFEWETFPNDDGHRVTAPVASYAPNPLGLHDIIGNVYEWCADWYGTYPEEPVTDPSGPPAWTARVLRGGSWFNQPRNCRAARRDWNVPTIRNIDVGFRLLATRPSPRRR